MKNMLLTLGALLSLSLAASATPFEIQSFNVPCDGGQEVPSNGSAGMGFCTVTIDDVTGDVTVSGSFSNMTGNVTVAHIHGPANPGANAGVVLALSPSGTTNGTITGAGTYSAGQLADALAGLHYINIHSTAFPGGELRGQIVQPVPVSPLWSATATILLLSAAGFFFLRRREPSLA